uniref:Uncharacterized protein n=1 Tax=Cannabis sativa TaxID=3483 RepID=A0A803QZT3_CANSA
MIMRRACHFTRVRDLVVLHHLNPAIMMPHTHRIIESHPSLIFQKRSRVPMIWIAAQLIRMLQQKVVMPRRKVESLSSLIIRVMI